jgi:TRAP-type C4-dicarboxylate transport system permease small subunit
LRYLDLFEEYVCAFLIAMMATLAFANVLVRYLTDQSLAFTEELIINLFVLATLLGASMAFKRGAHLGMTFIDTLLPPKALRWVSVLVTVCGVVLFVILFYFGVDMVMQEYESEMVTYSMALPMWWFGLSVPVGCVLVVIRIIQAAIQELRDLNAKARG